MGRLPQAAPGPPPSSGKQAREGASPRASGVPPGRAAGPRPFPPHRPGAAVGRLPLRANRRANSLRRGPESGQARPREGRGVRAWRGAGSAHRRPRTRLPAPLRRRPQSAQPRAPRRGVWRVPRVWTELRPRSPAARAGAPRPPVTETICLPNLWRPPAAPGAFAWDSRREGAGLAASGQGRGSGRADAPGRGRRRLSRAGRVGVRRRGVRRLV